MNQYSKKKKELKKLAEIAYEREMEKALDGLYERFSEWKQKSMDVFDLNEHRTI